MARWHALLILLSLSVALCCLGAEYFFCMFGCLGAEYLGAEYFFLCFNNQY